MRKARNIFWIVFALSILFICVILGPLGVFRLGTGVPISPTGIPNPIVTPYPVPTPQSQFGETIVIWVPLITAITSLIGGVATTIGTFRKDKLEARKTELDLEERKIELEKKKLDAEIEIAKKQRELEELKRKDPKDGG